ncbi:signal peptidase i : Signal peptidase I OS=Isosphaera pallida (strain ATCC 43644 / DSM 9630 / IS1B) GN=Isop_0732 PE=3 SV=1: Peptidase_S24 [Gemmataceae bacterium]|nr:signal peptidase i : Signal peptidase I OS=Isosphaera pallida (strain ATCC 43644 / DSM 9630 / IS1B) GN=Isop_0732 PE=3 SV=1: Peptidase_S24 [Gemmataceae bacterium]VTT99477.1 signal peptidase i : Signal peptidase I OS=Isosphaera pallida (strain ATCC 43644 / DSM 9630 / IS1B) GN=Isop_0732 PE=3 SV=1: Peptidase_S24 [Gemmataceae bacterium]
MDHPDAPPAADPPADPAAEELPLADELPVPLPAPEPLPVADELPTPLPLPVPEPAPAAPDQPRPGDHGPSPYRVLVNIAAVFVSLFLFIRVVALEPFGVPTGSMAPALLGNHREGPCPRCGYPVRVGAPASGVSAAEQYDAVACPNCGQRFSLADAMDLNGDRLLVDKNVFNLRRPRRWEMGVFHCPDPEPKEYRKPYVKRVVGLPGETISILNGEVYADGELLRKSLPELRETRFPVYDMAFVPDPGGWNARWLADPAENDPRLPPASDRQPEPASDAVVTGGELHLDAGRHAQAIRAVTYRNWSLDDREEQAVRVWNSYDGLRSVGRLPVTKRSFEKLPTANDFSVSCDVEVLASCEDGSFACRLMDGADAVSAEVTVGTRAGGLAIVTHEGKGPLETARGVALEVGRTHRFEFSFVDRRALLAIDGKTVAPAVDLPPAQTRGEVRRPLQFGARGSRLVVRNLKLYRDVYYTQFGEHGTQPPHGAPVTLGPDEFFMMGDNSGNSQDSRKWPTPGVPEAEFIGKPFLIHQPLRAARVTAGGRERQFQTVDWNRLRWLH